VRSLVQHIDLLPTMLDYASVPVPEALRGASLRAEIEGSGSHADRLIASGNRHTGALRDGRYKLLYPGKDSEPQLFDLEADPLERTDVSDAHPIRLAFMLEEMARIETESQASGALIQRKALKLTAEKLEELRALGYLE
jgi:arylsulfatase A-like enzyme